MEQNQEQPKSLLQDLRQHHIVQVHNVLTQDFTWPLARSINQLSPQYRDPHIDKLNLRNDSHPTMQHVIQRVTIPAGSTMNLPGDVAQVYVKHLVDEVLTKQGKKSLKGDPTLRREAEDLVINNIDDLRSQVQTMDIQEQLDKQLSDLNPGTLPEEHVVGNEQAFPGLSIGEGSGETGSQSGNATATDKITRSRQTTATK